MPIIWIDGSSPIVIAAVLGGLAAIVCALWWWWWRRLTWPETPWSRRRWLDVLDRQGDGFKREISVLQWSTLHDGLLARPLRRLGGRFARAVAELATSMVTMELAAAEFHRCRGRAHQSCRRLLSSTIAGRLVPLLVLGADLVLASLAIQAVSPELDWMRATVVALTVSLTYVVAGRVIADGLLHGRLGRTIAGSLIAITIAAVMASLRFDYRWQWFLMALAPTAVSVMVSLLNHPETPEIELALQEERKRRRQYQRALDRLTRRLAKAGDVGALLTYRAAPSLVARPRAVASGEPAPIVPLDVAATLAELGLSRELEVLRHAHELVRKLRQDAATSPHDADTGAGTGLRSVA